MLTGHNDGVNSALFSSDGGRHCHRLFRRTARVWDAVSGSEIARITWIQRSSRWRYRETP